MKKVTVYFGQTTVNKVFKEEPLTKEEKYLNIKTYEFSTDVEMNAFLLGIEDGAGWQALLPIKEC